MNVLTKDIQKPIFYCILFADDIIFFFLLKNQEKQLTFNLNLGEILWKQNIFS